MKSRTFSSLRHVYNLLFFPMETTRYFEFDFVWESLNQSPVNCYLDVSSPRILPLLFLHKNSEVKAELINPDIKDFAITAGLIDACNLSDRCSLHDCLINNVPFENASFDLITCISVLEHIPDNDTALIKIWGLLKPGGKLLLTLPCLAEATEQYISKNKYGVLLPGADGYTFWQLYYDQNLLEQKIFNIIGEPVHKKVYGEKHAGSFAENSQQKRLRGAYPFWREPFMMGEEYTYFSSIKDLPGEGVIAMEFIKQ
ncbi:MAG: methyltransferase domain-containing protein [Proteobacteria bacterium]|nr:methyltransferase domain-containing protein [Pseudomonadota bacterium]MBU1709840.1 methyltransferase domain-containing protein [Pseudomonadota bacterium]